MTKLFPRATGISEPSAASVAIPSSAPLQKSKRLARRGLQIRTAAEQGARKQRENLKPTAGSQSSLWGLRRFALLALLCLCNPATAQTDPLEPANRVVFAFNTALDRVLIKPAAQVYRAAAPQPVEEALSRFFSNLNEPWTAINQTLQGDFAGAGNDLARFAINSTLGVAGFFDIASDMNLPKNRSSVDQTLAVWGVPRGPYIVLPMLGPSSARGIVSQYAGNFSGRIGQPILYVNDVPARNSLFFTLLVSMRAAQLQGPQPPAGMDLYTLTRNFYWQRTQP